MNNLTRMPQTHPPTCHSIQESAKAVFRTLWQDQLDQQPKLTFYRSIKNGFSEEPYLSLFWQHRTALTRIRISAHNLNIERGRYSRSENTLAFQRLCPYCCTPDVAYFHQLPLTTGNDPIVEDEAHALSTCPAYHHIRVTLPEELKSALLRRDYREIFAYQGNYTNTLSLLGNAVRKIILTRRLMDN